MCLPLRSRKNIYRIRCEDGGGGRTCNTSSGHQSETEGTERSTVSVSLETPRLLPAIHGITCVVSQRRTRVWWHRHANSISASCYAMRGHSTIAGHDGLPKVVTGWVTRVRQRMRVLPGLMQDRVLMCLWVCSVRGAIGGGIGGEGMSILRRKVLMRLGDIIP